MPTAILLAAGRSLRMGAQNKLLMPYGESCMVRLLAERLLQSKAAEVIVVLGHEAEPVRAALEGLQVHFAFNKQYHDGMTSSIQAGVRAARADAAGYLICPADMPFLTTEDYNHILKSLSGKREILVPTYRGQRGNPVFFSRHFKQKILAHTEPEGCKGIVKAHIADVSLLPFPNKHILNDIDKPEDLAKAR